MGIATLGALAAAPAEQLRGAFGQNLGRELQARARFEGSATVTPVREAVSESRETTFDVDIADPGRLEEHLRRLAAELCAGLERQGRRGRTIAIKVRLADFTTVTRARTLAVATGEPGPVTEVALGLLRDYAPAQPVRLLGVRVAGFAQDEERAQLALDV
jgi:DNA polymerase-4